MQLQAFHGWLLYPHLSRYVRAVCLDFIGVMPSLDALCMDMSKNRIFMNFSFYGCVAAAEQIYLKKESHSLPKKRGSHGQSFSYCRVTSQGKDN